MESKSLILVVDDEPSNFEVIEILLFQEDYELKYLSSGSEAIAFLQQSKPDVILLDVMMPELDGITVCHRIKEKPEWQHIPIVMVTALSSKEDLARCLNAGADDFIGKPVNGSELRARVRSMLRIKHQYDQLEHLMAFREDMCDMIVHDLRNPLSIILTACQILQLQKIPQQYQPKINQIELAGWQLQQLIDSILWMAKLKAGKLEIHKIPIDLVSLGKSAIADFRGLAAQRSIKLVGEFPTIERETVLDEALIRRVIENLLSNAIKFSPKDSQIVLKVTYPAETQVTIQVADQGLGMSEDFQSQLFQKYMTGIDLPDVTQTGLGLAFCKLAVDAHGGQISVQSEVTKGTTFTVEIDANYQIPPNPD